MEYNKNTAQTATDVYTMLAAGGFKVLEPVRNLRLSAKRLERWE